MNEKIIAPKYEFSEGYHKNITIIDTIPPDMIHLVDYYWYQFEPMSSTWYMILGFTVAMLGVCSLIGNFLVFFIFITTKSLRTPSNLFVLNLSVADFMTMFTMFPPTVLNCYFENWVFGPLMCEIYSLCGSTFGCASIWSMTLIAFDRYNVIVKGIAGKPLTMCNAIIQILCVWIFCAIWGILPLFGWNRYVPEGNMTTCGTDYLTEDWLSRSYIIIYSIWAYLVPLLLIIYSYSNILKTVSAHEKSMREQAKKMNVDSLRSSEDKNKSVEIKLAKVTLCTISLWFLAWTPYTIINYMGIFGYRSFTPLATIWGAVFAKTNSVLNPIVYAISHPKYKSALYQKLPCLSCLRAETSDIQSTVTDVDKQ